MVLAILPWLASGRTTWLGSKLVVFEFSFWFVGQIRDDHIFAGESLAGGRDIDLVAFLQPTSVEGCISAEL
jgi:hypothetical protein